MLYIKILFLILPLLLLLSCTAEQQKTNTDATSLEKIDSNKPKPRLPKNTPQQPSIEERIQEIRTLYASIQNLPQKEHCIHKTKNITFEVSPAVKGTRLDKAIACQQGDFAYKKLHLEYHEGADKYTFYYKNNQLFFVFLEGYSEITSYEYRIYYARDGKEVIRILEKEQYHGKTPVSMELIDKQRRQEFLHTIELDKKRMLEILQQ